MKNIWLLFLMMICGCCHQVQAEVAVPKIFSESDMVTASRRFRFIPLMEGWKAGRQLTAKLKISRYYRLALRFAKIYRTVRIFPQPFAEERYF
jgi:hypothetical protein